MKPIFYLLLTAALSLNAAGCTAGRLPNDSADPADAPTTQPDSQVSRIPAEEAAEHGGVTKQLKLELDYAKMIVNKQEDLTWLR